MTLIAEWQSKGGAHGVALRSKGLGVYGYIATNGSRGGFPAASDKAAVSHMEAPAWPDGPRKVDLHQPDKNKTPMERVS